MNPFRTSPDETKPESFMHVVTCVGLLVFAFCVGGATGVAFRSLKEIDPNAEPPPCVDTATLAEEASCDPRATMSVKTVNKAMGGVRLFVTCTCDRGD